MGTWRIAPGDEVYAYVTYNPGNGWATFEVADLTPADAIASIVARNFDTSYFDGTSADYIEENGEYFSGGVEYRENLRKWYLYTVDWYNAEQYTSDGKGTTIAQNPYALVQDKSTVTPPGGINGVLATILNDLNSSNSFTDHWQGCY